MTTKPFCPWPKPSKLSPRLAETKGKSTFCNAVSACTEASPVAGCGKRRGITRLGAAVAWLATLDSISRKESDVSCFTSAITCSPGRPSFANTEAVKNVTAMRQAEIRFRTLAVFLVC